MKAKDVMTHCLVTIAPDAPIIDAITHMISHQVSGMPVIDGAGKLVGMVTEGDFLRRPEIHTEAPRRRWVELLLGSGSGADEYAHSHGRTVHEVMSTNLVTVDEQTPLREVAGLMEEYGVKRIPVVGSDGKVVGIVSRADLMSALAEVLSESKKVPADDQSIRRVIVSEMKRQPWCPVQSLRIRVRGGYVDLSGTIFDERQRQALHVLVENVQGVKGIHDHIGEFLANPVREAAKKGGAKQGSRASRSSH